MKLKFMAFRRIQFKNDLQNNPRIEVKGKFVYILLMKLNNVL